MTDAAPTRWTPSAKEALLLSLLRQEITVAEAQQRYALTLEELDNWIARFRANGRRGLQVSTKRRVG